MPLDRNLTSLTPAKNNSGIGKALIHTCMAVSEAAFSAQCWWSSCPHNNLGKTYDLLSSLSRYDSHQNCQDKVDKMRETSSATSRPIKHIRYLKESSSSFFRRPIAINFVLCAWSIAIGKPLAVCYTISSRIRKTSASEISCRPSQEK